MRPPPRGFWLCLAFVVALSLAPADTKAADAPTAQMLRIEQALRAGLGFTKIDFHDYTGFRSVTGVPVGQLTAGGSQKLVAVDVYPDVAAAAARFALDRDFLLSNFAGNLEKGAYVLVSNRLLAIVNRKAVTSFTTTTVEGKTRAIGGAEVVFLCDNLFVKVIYTSASTIAYPESNLEQLNAETERLGQAALAPLKTFTEQAVDVICPSTSSISIEQQLKYSHVVKEEFLQGTVTLKVTGAWASPSLTVWVAIYNEAQNLTLADILTGKVTTGGSVGEAFALRSVSPVSVGTFQFQLGENLDLAIKAPKEYGPYVLIAVAGDPTGGFGLNVFGQTALAVEQFPQRFYLRSATVSPTLDGGVGDTFSLDVVFDVGSAVGLPAVSVRSNLTGPDPRGIPAVAATNMQPILGKVGDVLQTIGYSGRVSVKTPPLIYAGQYGWPFTLFAPGWEPLDGASNLIVDFTGHALAATGAVTVENASGVAEPATNVLRFGRRLRTPANGEALITFQNGATVKVSPGTTMRVENDGRVHVESGEVSVVGDPGEAPVVTPLATVSPTGTAFTVSHTTAPAATSVSVTTGQVQVTPTNAAFQPITVLAGQGVEVVANASIVAPPVISTPPTAVSAITGKTAQFSVAASGGAGLSYQWQRKLAGQQTWSDLANGGAFSGATSASLSVSAAVAMSGDQFRVVVETASGSSATSPVATLTVTYAPRLLNLSTRGLSQTGDNVLIPGFVISGSANKRLLIRAVGPTLSAFGVSGVLADPQVTLKRLVGSAYIDVATNDDWSTNANAAEIVSTSANVFAFALSSGSKDSALLLDLVPGQYSIVSSGVNDGTGVAIVELYDTESSGAGSHLANISNRGFVGTNSNIMIPGFVVSSEGAKTLLVRAVGPGLAQFGVGGVLADPQLAIFYRPLGGDTDTQIFTQDNWSDHPDAANTATVAAQVFAFSLATGSKDAAIVVTLQPGIYTVHASGVGGTTGVALVEIYEGP